MLVNWRGAEEDDGPTPAPESEDEDDALLELAPAASKDDARSMLGRCAGCIEIAAAMVLLTGQLRDQHVGQACHARKVLMTRFEDERRMVQREKGDRWACRARRPSTRGIRWQGVDMSRAG